MVGAETTETGGALSEQDERVLQRVGYAQAASRSATAVLVDHELRVASSGAEGVEILSIQDALMRYDWVQDLMFNLIAPDENELLRQAAELLNDPIGCFITSIPACRCARRSNPSRS